MITQAKKLVRKGDAFIQKFGMEYFHEEASRLLGQSDFAKSYDFQRLAVAAFDKSFSREQTYAHFQFSDLPLTLARGEHCFVDLYFWRRRPTVIHNHHFIGAFQCIEGHNVDLEFSFDKQKKLTKNLTLGTIEVHKILNLKSGDIQPIAYEDKFIHQNHHHAELTVNVCFRTPEIQPGHISNYLFSGLRYEKNPQILARANRLEALIRLDDFDYKKLDLSVDDAAYFLIQTYGFELQNKRLTRLKKYLSKLFESHTGLDLLAMIRAHEDRLDSIQDSYF